MKIFSYGAYQVIYAQMERFRFEEQESKTCSELARFDDTEENHQGMFEEIHLAMAMRLELST